MLQTTTKVIDPNSHINLQVKENNFELFDYLLFVTICYINKIMH